MEYVPAEMLRLWIGMVPVVRAIVFPALTCTLFIPAVYNAADHIFGGRNQVGRAPVTAIRVSFCQFHTTTVQAIVSDQARRRHHLKRRLVANAVPCAYTVASIFRSRVDATNHNLPLAYGNQLYVQVFLWTGLASI